MGKSIRGILFDLGDTLLDFGPVRINRLFVEGARRGYHYLHDLDKPLPHKFIYLLRQLWAVRWAYVKSRIRGREFNSLELLDRQARRMGHPLEPDEALELAWRFYSPLKERARVEPDLHDALGQLQTMGLKLGIVSNTFLPAEVLDRHLAEEDLLDYFPQRLYSCQFGRRKPDRRIFQQGLEMIGLGARETLFVGDTPKEDIRGACDVGMVTVLKDPTGRRRKRRPRADYVIDRIAELPAVIRRARAEGRGDL